MHCHSAPSVPRPHPFTATRPRAYRFGTLTPVWQPRSHCHSALNVPRPHPFTATRPRAYRSHCHSALNATCGTFTGEWQCRCVVGCPDCLSRRIHVGRRIEVRAHSRYMGRAVSPTRARCRPREQSCILSPSGAHVLPFCPCRAYTFFRCAYMSLICGDPVAVAEVIGVGCVRTREEKGQLT